MCDLTHSYVCHVLDLTHLCVHVDEWSKYEVAAISRLLKNIGLFVEYRSLL